MLARADVLAVEDTRVTAKLLNLLGVERIPRLVSCHKFNEKSKLAGLLGLVAGHRCGLISDAGYPAVSDPGQPLVAAIRETLPDVAIEVVNGPNAALCALVGSGFDATSFHFAGFLDRADPERDLARLRRIKSTIAIYESVHRIAATLKAIAAVFGEARVCVARELTKMNETYYFGTAEGIIPKLTLKGEFVVLIDNARNKAESDAAEALPGAIEDVRELIGLNVRLKDACKFAAKRHGVPASLLYERLQGDR